MCILILIDSCLKMIWRGLNINNRIQDPTGFENSDRNQENEESEEIAFGRIIINESYTEGWNMYQPKTKRI